MSPPETNEGAESSMDPCDCASTSADVPSLLVNVHNNQDAAQLQIPPQCDNKDDKNLFHIKKQVWISKLVKQRYHLNKHIKNTISHIDKDKITIENSILLIQNHTEKFKNELNITECKKDDQLKDKGTQTDNHEMLACAVPCVTRGVEDWRKIHTTREKQHRFVLQNQLFADVTFLLGPQLQDVHCHKLPLARASRVLQTMLYGDAEQPPVPMPIELPNISPEIFHKFLEYIYLDHFEEIEMKNFGEAGELLKVAKKFDIPELIRKCRNYLWLHVNRDTIWVALDFTLANKETQLFNNILKVLAIHAEDALLSKEIEKISTKTMTKIMSAIGNQFNIKSEVNLLDACVRWCQAQKHQTEELHPPCLNDAFVQFRNHIKFLNLTPNEFAKYATSIQFLHPKDALSILSNLILQYTNTPNLPLPDYVIKSQSPRILQDEMANLHVYGVTKDQFDEYGNLKDTSEPSIHTMISVITLTNVNKGSVLSGISFSTKISKASVEYEENISVFVNDIINGVCLYSTTETMMLPSNTVFCFWFNKKIHFTLIPKTTIEIKILFHKSGNYPLLKRSLDTPEIKVVGKNKYHYQSTGTYSIIVAAIFKKLHNWSNATCSDDVSV